MKTPWYRGAIAALAVAVTLGMTLPLAEARPSGGFRGARSGQSVPATPTAPRTATPAPAAPSPTQAARPAPGINAAQAPSFGRTLMGGFAAGLIGAGLFGLLTGSGLFGNLGGFASILGLLLQAALIFFAIRFIWGFIRRRREPQAAYAGSGRPNDFARTGMNPAAAMQAAPLRRAPPQPERQRSDAVGIGPSDYAAFEGLLGQVMQAYGSGDVATLRNIATPELLADLERDLSENARRGVVNRLGAPSLLQGDLAEAWSEDGGQYATVAMRFALTDAMVDMATGRVVDGNLSQPNEATEAWTFRRDAADQPWRVTGIEAA